jgi:carbon-monoxide dehydrogenase medium subunit
MRPFDYRAPASIDEAVAILAEKGDRARPLAGGTDLLVQLRRRLYDLDLLVDVKRIPDLNLLSFSRSTGLTVGAAISCAQLVEHVEAARAYPGLVDAASIIGGSAIQGRATIAGNLCNAAPSGDAIPALIVLDATCTIAGPEGTRTLRVCDFCLAPGQTALQRGEMLVSLHLPPPQPNAGAAYMRFTPRHEMDIAVAGAGAWVQLTEDGLCIQDAQIALSSVAPIPLFVRAAGAVLVGEPPASDTFAKAAMLAQEAAQPITDVRGTSAQRQHLVGVLVKRALRSAVRRAEGGTGHDQ